VCLGLDPEPAAPEAVSARCRALIDAAGPSCVAVKPQVACFERLGAAGWAVLAEIVAAAQAADLLVIADAKRGDVPHIATVYAEGMLGEMGEGLGANALTVNPLMGGDVLDAFVDVAAGAGAGLFALVRTSNPGATDVLDLPAPEAPLWERLATMVAERATALAGESGLSGMAAVVGATNAGPLARLRELMPSSIFLLPGVGAQGGTVGELGPALGEHPASVLVTASRSIAGADDPRGAAESLRAEAWALFGG
jgi:orotidine-5'-phosphate decarboxylase